MRKYLSKKHTIFLHISKKCRNFAAGSCKETAFSMCKLTWGENVTK